MANPLCPVARQRRRCNAVEPGGEPGDDASVGFKRCKRESGRAAAAAIAILCCTAMFATVARADAIAGQASVIDGDTLDIHGERIRLAGIDAPEHDQLCDDQNGKHYQCGSVAANKLADFLDRRPIVCPPLYNDQYGRTVAYCTVAGQDLGEWLVKKWSCDTLAEIRSGRQVYRRPGRRTGREAGAVGRGVFGALGLPFLPSRRRTTARMFGPTPVMSVSRSRQSVATCVRWSGVRPLVRRVSVDAPTKK